MSLIASETGGTSRPLTPAGTHIARCFSIIDLGTQHGEYLGKPKVQRKLRIGWELPNERAVFTEEKGEQPYSVYKEYTVSLSEKANLRHDLEGWRGVPFTEKELKGFDLKTILGKACLVTVIHQRSKDGTKTYDKVSSVAGLPKTKPPTICPPQENPTLVYDIDEGENEVFEKLPEWLRTKIMESDEAKGGNSSTAPAEGETDPFNDDVPF